MLTLPVQTLVEETGGELVCGRLETMVNGVSIDTRTLEPGAVFVALEGEHVDGVDFVPAAIESGARAVIVARHLSADHPALRVAQDAGVAVVRVNDAVAALQSLASYHRARLHCQVIGVTGSTGKTTTKDFLDAVLSARFRTVSTTGNQNNELGVPLTILRAGAQTDVLIVEMGMRGIGQIARLAQIAQPRAGLVTNVGMSHIEILGTQESVASAKGELVRAVPAEGAVFLNGDDAYSDLLAEAAEAPVTRYGLSDPCDVRAEHVSMDASSHASFTLIAGEDRAVVRVPLPGRHNVYNALAAAAVGHWLGLSAEDIARGLAGAEATAMRMQLFTTADGITVINDAYNANPVSMRAALDTLAALRVGGRRVAVLGDMAELGSLTEVAHFEIGEYLAGLGLDALVTVGPRAVRIAEGARAKGMDPTSVRSVDEPESAASYLVGEVLEPSDAVLVKASRVMELERVVEGIVNSDV